MSKNFDGEVEGTSPPADFINQETTHPMIELEVDDVQSHSSPHSCKMLNSASTGRRCRVAVSFDSSDSVEFWVYVDTPFGPSVYYLFALQATTGDWNGSEQILTLFYNNDGNIYYYKDAAWNDTGIAWTANAWKKFRHLRFDVIR